MKTPSNKHLNRLECQTCFVTLLHLVCFDLDTDVSAKQGYFEAIIVNFSTYHFIKIKVAVKCMQMFAVSFTLLGWGSKKPRQLLVYVVVPEKLTF